MQFNVTCHLTHYAAFNGYLLKARNKTGTLDSQAAKDALTFDIENVYDAFIELTLSFEAGINISG